MANDYVIDTIFNIVDGATKPLQKIGIGAANVGKQTNAMKAMVNRDVANAKLKIAEAGTAIKQVGKMAATVAVGTIAAGLAVATKQYIEFDNAVKQSGALFKDLDPTSESFASSLDAIGKKAREVAGVTEFNAVDTAGALSKMAMAGMSSEVSMALLAGTTDLATAAGTDLTTAVDIATDALGAFKLEATADNLARVSDVMALTSSTANTSLIDMFEAIKYAGPGFTAAGQSVETLSAAIGTLANAGIKGSSAGTALQAIFTQLSSQNKIDELAAIGVAVSDSEGNFRNLYDIVGDLEKATADWGEVAKSSLINSVFGTRGAKAVNLLLAQGSDALKQYENDLYNAGGSAAQMAGVMRSSLANQIEVLKSGLTELGFKFVEAFKDRGSQGLQIIIEAIQNFDPQPIIDFLVNVVDHLVSIGIVVKNVIQFAWQFKELIIAVIAAWMGYKAVIMIIAAQQMIVNAIMNANPIGIIITAIGLLVGAIVWLVANWDTVIEVMSRVWEKIKEVASVIWDTLITGLQVAWEWVGNMAQQFGFVLGPIGYLISAVKELADNWGYVVAAFQNGGILQGIKTIGLSLLSGVLAPIQSLLELLSNIPGLGYLAGIGADKIAQLRSNMQGSVEAATVAPVTNRDATMISRSENISTANVNIGLEKGLTGTVTGSAPNVTLQTQRSGVYRQAM